MALPRLPEPGTPAYTATADQFEAAQRDATRQAAALLHAGALLVTPTGPWAGAMFDSISAGQPYRQVCRRVDRADVTRGPLVMYVAMRGALICPRCFATVTAVPSPRCTGCGRERVGPLPHRVHVAQRRHILAYGRLCMTCSSNEHRPEGP